MVTGTAGGRIGLFDRVRTGWTLTTDSAGVIRENPELLAFPLIAAAASAGFFVVFLIPMLVANLVGSGVEYVALFVWYFVTTFLSTYAAAALVHATNETFHGRNPSVRASLSAVWGRLGPIVAWSLISATVSVLIKVLEDSDNPVADLLGALFAVGWSVTTFFVVPVLVFEEVTVTSMFSRSAATFRDTWGETLGAGFGVTLVVGLFGIGLVVAALAVSLPLAAAFPAAGGVVGVVLVAVALATTYLLSQTIWGVAKTALYVYAAEGEVPSQFDNFELETLGGRTARTASPGSAGPRDAL